MKICNQHQISLPQTDSSGLNAVEVVEDNVIVDDRGQPRTMTCRTEKSKHLCERAAKRRMRVAKRRERKIFFPATSRLSRAGKNQEKPLGPG